METVQEEKKFVDIAIDSVNEGVLIVNPEGVILSCNSRLAGLVRMPFKEIVGNDWAQLFQDYERPLLREFLKQASHGSGKERFVLRPRDSAPLSVQVSAQSIALNGLEICVVLVYEQGFELLLESLRDSSIIMLDPHGRITYWNMGAQQINSYQSEEVLGKSLNVLYPPEDCESGKPYRELEKAAAEGKLEVEGWRVRKDGTRVWVNSVITALHDSSGTLRGYMRISRDITERRLAEELRVGENRLLEMIANRAPLAAILNTLTQTVEAQSPGMLCSVLLLDEKGERLKPAAGSSLPESYVRETEGFRIGPNAGSCGSAAFEKKPVIAEDILTDPHWANYRYVVPKYGLRACWSTPVFSHTGKVLGTFAMYYRYPKAPGPAEQRLIEIATNIAKIAIEHQQADEALRQSEEQFRTAFAGAAVGMAILDLNRQFRETNEAYSRIIGYSTQELIGKPSEAIIHPDDLAKSREIVDKLLAREIPNSVDQKRYIAKGGGVVWVQNSLSLLCDSHGCPVVMLLITEDITQRKQAEDELRRSEERFRTMTDMVPGFIFTSRPEGWTDYVNRSFYEYIGWPVGTEIGYGWRELLHPQDRESVSKQLQESFETGKPFNIQYRLRGADGTHRWFLVRGRCIRDSKGKIVQWLGTGTDIEEQKQAEEILEERVAQRTAKLRETVEELEQYSYSITHDLRAPLRAIQGFARLLEEEGVGQLSPMTQDYLQRIAASTRRMDNLIRDSLNYGKLLQTEMKLEPVDLALLLREVIQAYPALQPPHASISMGASIPAVLGNDSALSQCVSNLLLNAVKFVAPGKHPCVKVWVENRGDWVRVWFEDNGIGIAAEAQEEIFGMFQQLSRAYEGTGVGLAIVRKAAERMGGKVGVESTPGMGSRFWLDLRRAP